MSMFKKPTKKTFKVKKFGDETEDAETEPSIDDTNTIAKPDTSTNKQKKKTLLSFEDDDNDNDNGNGNCNDGVTKKTLAKKVKKKKRKKIVHDLKGVNDDDDDDASVMELSSAKDEVAECDDDDDNLGVNFSARVAHKFDYSSLKDMSIQRGFIPDAATIHAARKSRQHARQMSYLSFSPEREPACQKENLVEIEVSDDEVIEMKLNNGPEKTIGDDEIFIPNELNDWENQQIRKGVSNMKVSLQLQQGRDYGDSTQFMDESGDGDREQQDNDGDVEDEDLDPDVERARVFDEAKSNIVELQSLIEANLKSQADKYVKIDELKMCFRDYSDNFERAQRIEIFLCVFFEAVSDIYNRIITIEDKYVDLCANRTNLVTERHRKFIEAQSVSVKKSLELNEFIDLTDNEVQTFDEEVGRLDIEFQDLKRELDEDKKILNGNPLTIRNILNFLKTLRESDVNFFNDTFDFNEMIPKAIEPFIRMEFLLKNPLHQPFCIPFDANWVVSLMLFSCNDNYLLSKVVEDTILNIILKFVHRVWNPMDKKESEMLTLLLKTYISDYPTITHGSTNIRKIVEVAVERFNESLERDIFLPLLATEVVSEREIAFFESQFEQSLRFLDTLMLWAPFFNDNILIQLTLTNFINKRLLSALHISNGINKRAKIEKLLRSLPNSWLNSNILQLNAIRNFLDRLK